MSRLEFQGFGGLSLVADSSGDPADPPVLLVHGGGQSKTSWRAAAAALAEAGRYAITLDLRGHGHSAWPKDGRYDLDAFVADLHAVLGALSRRPVIVATSLGGLIALVTLGEAVTELAAGLVLVDTTPNPDPEEEKRVRAMLNHREGSERPDPRFIEIFDSTNAGERITKALSKIRIPTLVVRGTKSDLASQRAAEQLREGIEEAELVEIEGAAHLLVSERSDAFNALLLEFLERRAPRIPLRYEAGSDERTLRDALGCFATGITVVTTLDEQGKPVGLTANSFTSVSLEPPLILFCLARSSSNLRFFERAGKFGVNVLHIGQQPTSDRFARRAEDRFSSVDWEFWETGVPILRSALSSFECDTYAVHDGGDHVILIGRVKRASFEPSRDPLLYFRGKYRRLHFA